MMKQVVTALDQRDSWYKIFNICPLMNRIDRFGEQMAILGITTYLVDLLGHSIFHSLVFTNVVHLEAQLIYKKPVV